jgi:hypothetical protein
MRIVGRLHEIMKIIIKTIQSVISESVALFWPPFLRRFEYLRGYSNCHILPEKLMRIP